MLVCQACVEDKHPDMPMEQDYFYLCLQTHFISKEYFPKTLGWMVS